MKKLSLSKEMFEQFVFPVVATSSGGTMAQVRLAHRLLDKLEACADKVTEELTDQGLVVVASLNGGLSAEVELDDAEAALLAKLLEQAVPGIANYRARKVLPLIDELKDGG